MTPLITLLTDYGTRDGWVAMCKGAILAIVPDVRLLDISHAVEAFDVIGGALLLAATLPELPVGVHVAVVDPGVGTDRRSIGIATARGDLLVGPDNGLLLPAADALGGITAVHELENERYRRPAVTRTFHGRDIFAPAAAHLALGVPLDAFGPAIEARDLVCLEIPAPNGSTGLLETTVIAIDSFGNVDVAGVQADLEAALGPLSHSDTLLVEWRAAAGEALREPVTWGRTFADVAPGALLLYENALGRLSLAVNQGSATVRLGLGAGATVSVRRGTP